MLIGIYHRASYFVPWLWRLNSLFIIVVLITGTWIKLVKVLDMKFHDLSIDRVSFVYNSYEVFHIKNFVKELLSKRTLIIAKAIPWIPEPAFLSLLNFISVKSCWVLLYSGFVDPCCRWASWADLFWIVLHDCCWFWRWEVNVWSLGRMFILCVMYMLMMPLHYYYGL